MEETFKEEIELCGWSDITVPARAMMLSSRALKLFTYLLYRGRNGGSCYPGRERMVEEFNECPDESWSLPTLDRAIKELKDKKFIHRIQKRGTSALTVLFKEERDYDEYMDTMQQALSLMMSLALSLMISTRLSPVIGKSITKGSKTKGEEKPPPSVPEKKPKPQKPSKPAIHPAWKAYQDMLDKKGIVLNGKQQSYMDEFYQVVGQDSRSISRLQRVLKHVTAKGWYLGNLENVIDQYKKLEAKSKNNQAKLYGAIN